MSGDPLAFVSHAEEDKGAAIQLKALLNEAAPFKVRIYVSSDTSAMPAGIDWLNEIREELSQASVFIFLASPKSLKASFALYEFGAALLNKPQATIIPICISGLTIRQLPDPFQRYQATEAIDPEGLRSAIGSILAACAGSPGNLAECSPSVDWNARHLAFRNAQEEGLLLDDRTLAACSFETLSRLEPLLQVRRGYSEERLYSTLIGRVLQSTTFDGSPIDDRFWAVFAKKIRERKDWPPQKKLAYVLSAARQGIIVTAKGDTYEVMDILRQQVHEYRATATDEELLRPESKKFLFASADPRILRLFILRDGKRRLEEFDGDRRKALNAQMKDGVEIRVLKWDEDRPPPNFGIYGNIAVGRLSPAGVNEIEFKSSAVNATRDEFEGLWLRGERMTQI